MNKRAFRAVLWDIDADKIDTLSIPTKKYAYLKNYLLA